MPIGFSASFWGPCSLRALAGIIRELVREAWSMRAGHGLSVMKRTVESLTIWTSLMGFQ